MLFNLSRIVIHGDSLVLFLLGGGHDRLGLGVLLAITKREQVESQTEAQDSGHHGDHNHEASLAVFTFNGFGDGSICLFGTAGFQDAL